MYRFIGADGREYGPVAGEALEGRGLAITGLVLSLLSLAQSAVLFVVYGILTSLPTLARVTRHW